MAVVTKTWKDRLVEYAGRRKLKNVATGEEVLMDVSRSEGTVSQAGDAFSAANMNNSSLKDSTSGESFNFGSLNGVRGFFTNPSKADDSFVPFSSGGFVFCGGNGHYNTLPDIWKYYTYSFSFNYYNDKVVSFAKNGITFLQAGKYKLTLKYTHNLNRIYIKANLNNAELETRYFDTEAKRTWELDLNVQKGDVLSFSVQCNNRNDLGDAWYDSTMVIAIA